jgi:hypothetical protein
MGFRSEMKDGDKQESAIFGLVVMAFMAGLIIGVYLHGSF